MAEDDNKPYSIEEATLDAALKNTGTSQIAGMSHKDKVIKYEQSTGQVGDGRLNPFQAQELQQNGDLLHSMNKKVDAFGQVIPDDEKERRKKELEKEKEIEEFVDAAATLRAAAWESRRGPRSHHGFRPSLSAITGKISDMHESLHTFSNGNDGPAQENVARMKVDNLNLTRVAQHDNAFEGSSGFVRPSDARGDIPFGSGFQLK